MLDPGTGSVVTGRVPGLGEDRRRAYRAALLGVGLNAWLGWWWADPVAALVIAALAVKEGLEVWDDDDD